MHACLYFIAPTGHGLKPLDVEFMRRIHKMVKTVIKTIILFIFMMGMMFIVINISVNI